eukprot:scaffold526_cov356-Prasinococcus_capsulatus_cf.AAC.7
MQLVSSVCYTRGRATLLPGDASPVAAHTSRPSTGDDVQTQKDFLQKLFCEQFVDEWHLLLRSSTYSDPRGHVRNPADTFAKTRSYLHWTMSGAVGSGHRGQTRVGSLAGRQARYRALFQWRS